MVHLRSGSEREWDEFPHEAEERELQVSFASEKNDGPWTLEWVQEDVKQDWRISLNDVSLGSLRVDENRMRVYCEIDAGAIASGQNLLRVECSANTGRNSDDIRVGRLILHSRPRREVVAVAKVIVNVHDNLTGRPIPARITVLESNHVLQETSATSTAELAVRPGVIYTSSGHAEFAVPAGEYVVYAGRGFEYSLAQRGLDVTADDRVEIDLAIQRQVDTSGFVACDPHIHSLTHSGHGDATVQERMVTLAAEGIELPIATDHNVHVNHEPFARQAQVRQYFTPVVGNEVTTPVGHFNIFPVGMGASEPEYSLTDWRTIFSQIYATEGVKVVILNHARDEHSGIRPFGPRYHLALVGENIDGWPMGFNAMEVLNSSATQTDMLQLFEDWLALLNRGYRVTPVGSSDSHDVARHFVGQGRTYIRCDDRDPSQIDIGEAVDNFRQGQVAVSYGLLVEVKAYGKYGPGELVPAHGGRAELRIRVLGPHWIEADRVALYMNGLRVKQVLIPAEPRGDLPRGVKWQGTWQVDLPSHDVHLVVMAQGPGIEHPYWRTAKPYQPHGSSWESHVFACTGPMWLDGDEDGLWSSAYEYARQLERESGIDLRRLLESLASYDEAVALQVAHHLQGQFGIPDARDLQASLGDAAPHVQDAFRRYAQAWRETQRARIERP